MELDFLHNSNEITKNSDSMHRIGKESLPQIEVQLLIASYDSIDLLGIETISDSLFSDDGGGLKFN